MTPLISVQNIVKNYRRMRALNDVSFEIQPGITGLLGPNGAGKSTLIKVLLGLVRVSSGSGTVLGNRLGKQGRLIRSKIGYMPEDDCYIPGLKGVEAVQFSACLAGIPATEALRRAHEILDFCGMKQERYRDIETYSTGMRQKIKFAAAIVHDPEILILDEATSNLDTASERLIQQSLDRLLSGRTTFAIAHRLSTIRHADLIVVLEHGTVAATGTHEELLERSPTYRDMVAVQTARPEEAVLPED